MRWMNRVAGSSDVYCARGDRGVALRVLEQVGEFPLRVADEVAAMDRGLPVALSGHRAVAATSAEVKR
jgi:hypothetical protein